MKIETYSKICLPCKGRGYVGCRLCSRCDGNGQVVVVDQAHTLRTAVSEFLADVRSKYLGAVKP